MEPEKNIPFVHLHVHTEYSLLDGMSKIPALVKKVKESGMHACAITDHGTCCGLVDFYDECRKQGIKPILGCEFYEAPGSRHDRSLTVNADKYNHLILLVKDETGYKNLCHLVSRSYTEGFYYKPRIDFELLEKYHEGLICLSACLAGSVPRAAVRDGYEKAEEIALRYRAIFGEDYYLEIQHHGIADEVIAAQALVKIARKHGIKLVCTNDVHYVDSADAEAHDWLVCLQTGKTIADDDRMRYEGDYSLKTGTEMFSLFPALPDAFENTLEVADKCNFEFHYGDYRMPKVYIPEEYHGDYFRYLSDEAWKGYEMRYPKGNPLREQAAKDLEYELSVIQSMGFAEYFLDTRKTISWAKSHGILVGPGRGSAAGSRMCYCLGITDLDPIPYDLLFERFLNPERISMPDIDTDYDFAFKDDVVAFEAESNGHDHFAKIQTFQPMLAKGVLRDAARVAGYPAYVGNKLASMIPEDKKVTLSQAWEMNEDLRSYIEADPQLKKLWDISLKLEGTKKSSGTHACGHIPTPVPCEDLFPVSEDPKTGYLVCQYNMEQAEHLGNLKKDLLMLRNLTVINVAHKAIKERYGKDIPLWTAEILNDPKALAMISAGDTNGVFQLESEGMKNFMKELKPSCFEDVIAGVALYRPGPMDFIPDYIRGKKDPSSVQYLVPQLEPILKATYGVIVYQEQVMQIVQKLAGFSMGRADVVRKAMGKKKQEIMDQEKIHFLYGSEELSIPGCIKLGIPEETAQLIYNQMADFAKYAFNKSHAAAYAAITMQTAYLKANYPLEFASGLFSSVMDKQKKLAAYINEYRRKGYKVLSPDINASGMNFTVSGDAICYGFASIKNAGADAVAGIIKEREEHGSYDGFCDFVKRNPSVNTRVIQALIDTGAFDCTGFTRCALTEAAPRIISGYKHELKSQCEGQMSLFDMFGEQGDPYTGTIQPFPEYKTTELLKREKEAAGFYISGHPMDEYEGRVMQVGACTSLDFDYDEENACYHLADGSMTKAAGIIGSTKVVYTKKDNKPMAFVTLEDRLGSVNVVMFPKVYKEYADLLREDAPVIISGQVSLDGEKGLSLLADEVTLLSNSADDLWIRFDTIQDYLSSGSASVARLIAQYPGTESSVQIYVGFPRSRKPIKNCITLSEACIQEAYNLFGVKNIAMVPAKA